MQHTLQLAEQENRGSDYGIGGFRKVIKEIGNTVKVQESARRGHAIQRRLYSNLKRHSEHLINAGAKPGPFVVLLGVAGAERAGRDLVHEQCARGRAPRHTRPTVIRSPAT